MYRFLYTIRKKIWYDTCIEITWSDYDIVGISYSFPCTRIEDSATYQKSIFYGEIPIMLRYIDIGFSYYSLAIFKYNPELYIIQRDWYHFSAHLKHFREFFYSLFKITCYIGKSREKQISDSMARHSIARFKSIFE